MFNNKIFIMSIVKNILLIAKNKGYYVDNNGNVFSSKKQLKLVKSYNRYSFSIRVESKRIPIPVQIFVAYLKYGDEIFKTGIEVRHLDNNSLNNSWSNILIGTHKENMQDVPKKIRIKYAINASSKNRRFTDEEVENIQLDKNNGYTYSFLCKKYNTSKSTLSYLFNKAYYNGNRTLK
jgi:hypothetical protein